MKLHHIGIITHDIRKSIQLYLRLGYSPYKGIVYDQVQNNYIQIMEANFSPSIELIEPVNEFSTVNNFNDGYHHICYEVDPNEDVVQRFSSLKVGKIFTSPLIAPALGNRKVVFAYLRNGTIIEFVFKEVLK